MKKIQNLWIQISAAPSPMWILHELIITRCGNVDSDRANKLSLLNNSWKSLIRSWEGSLGQRCHHPVVSTHKCSKAGASSDGLGQVHRWAVVAKVQSLSDAQLDQLSGSCAHTVRVFSFFLAYQLVWKKEIVPKVLSERSDFPNLWWTGLNSCV